MPEEQSTYTHTRAYTHATPPPPHHTRTHTHTHAHTHTHTHTHTHNHALKPDIGLTYSCVLSAMQTPEPLSPYFARRHRPPRALDGGGHRAYFRWEGNITREAFDRTHAELRHGDKCIRCGAQLPVKYQVHIRASRAQCAAISCSVFLLPLALLSCTACTEQMPLVLRFAFVMQIRGGHLYRHDNMSQFWTQTVSGKAGTTLEAGTQGNTQNPICMT